MISILLPTLLLSLIGIFNLFGTAPTLVASQTLFLIIGLGVFFIFKKIGRNFFASNTFLWYVLFIGILILTFIIGLEVKGSKRWINLLFFNFQASEFFKPFFILFFAHYLVQNSVYVHPARRFLTALLFFIIPALIILKQPDLGNAMVYGYMFIMLVLFSGVHKMYLLRFLLLISMAVPLLWNFLKPYQKDRILTFFNPDVDTQGSSYHIIQSIITIGSGQFLGKGLGMGTQSNLSFLPENHTDFAFSSLVEQLGFLGGSATIILFIILIFALVGKCFALVSLPDEQDKKKFLYTVGFLSYLIFSIFINIGMNVGIFPITGISLPFISYGGSSLVATMIGLAILP